MYTPHEVTVINAVRENGEMRYHAAVLHGVMMQAVSASVTGDSGLNPAASVFSFKEAATLFIPFSVKATSPNGETEMTWLSPLAYEAAADKSRVWTLRSGSKDAPANCFFIKGEATEPCGYAEANATYDQVYNITAVDIHDYGSPAMRHWEVTGV